MNVAAYARYSSDHQREESIDAQLRAIKEYASREGHTFVREYIDEARSATTDNRPHFQRMIADAQKGLFGAIIVHKLDRFSRDRYDSAYYKRLLSKHDVRLISVLEYLSDTPESVILESVLEGMAEYYSKNLAREVMKGMKETAYQCKHTGGKPPLGYDVNSDQSYRINEAEAEAVRMIFEMYINGDGYSAIIDALREKGYKTKLGNDFGKNSLYSVLTNEKYSGTFVFNKTERKIAGKRNGHRIKDDEEIIKIAGGIPAIISIEQWEEVKSRMEKNKHAPGAYTSKSTYLLSGHIFCGACGGAMIGKHGRMGRNKADYAYYECAARKRKRDCTMKPINRDVADAMVIEAMYENVFSPAAIGIAANKLYSFARSQRREIPAYVKTTKKQLLEVEKEISNIVSAISKGMFHESMKEKMDELEASKTALNVRIQEAEIQESAARISKEQIKAFLSKYSHIKEMTADEQKKVVELFKVRVVAYESYVDIDISPWTGPPHNGGGGRKTRVLDIHDGGDESCALSQHGPPPPYRANPSPFYPRKQAVRLHLQTIGCRNEKKPRAGQE